MADIRDEFPDERKSLGGRARRFWDTAVAGGISKTSLNSFLKDGHTGGGGQGGGRNQSSILINMIEKHNIPMPMIRRYIEYFKPNLQYYSFQTTALTAAISCKRNDVVRMLLDMPGLDVNKPCRVNHSTEFNPLSSNLTPLMFAIEHNCCEAVEILLDCKRINVNYKNIYGETALVIAYNKRWKAYEHIAGAGRQEHDVYYTKRTRHFYGDICLSIHTEYLSGAMSKDELRGALVKITPYFQRLYTFPGIHRSLQYVLQYCDDKDEHGQLTPVGYFSYDTQPYPYGCGQELYNAVMASDTDTVARLLADSCTDVNFLATDEHNWLQTPLHLAISENRLAIVQHLVQHPRIDINAYSWAIQITDWSTRVDTRVPFFTPLLTACERGSLAIVNCLLAHPDIDVNKIDVLSRKTGLMVAAKHGHADIVRRLLDIVDVDVNACSSKWYINRPIEEAVGHAAYQAMDAGHADIACEIMLFSRAAPHLYRAVLKEAAKQGSRPVVEVCLQLGLRDSRVKFRRAKAVAFLQAVDRGHIDIAELLYDAKQFRTTHYARALYLELCKVADAGSMDMLKFLVIKTSVDINGLRFKTDETRCSPLTAAIMMNNMEKVMFLLDRPEMCDTLAIEYLAQSTATREFSDGAHENMITYLTMIIDRRLYTMDSLHGAFMNLVVSAGETNDPVVFVDWLKLLSRVPGFDVNCENQKGERAFHLAIRHGSLHSLRYLLTFPTINIRYSRAQIGRTIPWVAYKIIQEYICVQREYRGLSEINLFGGFRELPIDVLRVVRGFLKTMPVPQLEERECYDKLRALAANEGEVESVTSADSRDSEYYFQRAMLEDAGEAESVDSANSEEYYEELRAMVAEEGEVE